MRALERDSRALLVERNRETTEIAYENARSLAFERCAFAVAIDDAERTENQNADDSVCACVCVQRLRLSACARARERTAAKTFRSRAQLRKHTAHRFFFARRDHRDSSVAAAAF